MILYFSGTGNSAFVAKKIAEEIDDKTINLFDKIKNRDYSNIYSEKPWVIAAPTYAWRIPRILHAWLMQAALSGSKDIYFVMTCGGSIGNSQKYLKKLSASKHMNYLGCYPIIMPENYIAMFNTPTNEDAIETIHQAVPEIDKAAYLIKNGTQFPHPSLTLKDKLNSGIVNDIFYPAFVHAKKFYAKDTCISCGKCATICPLSNIHVESGKPIWEKNCTHCMACICHCPTNAIEYGEHSKDLPRYTCPN